MKVTGTSHLDADRATVWQALNDPSVLVRTIPGCRRLEALGDDAYTMTIAAGVGSIKGVYDGQVRLTDQQQPGSFRMHAQGSGAPGTIGAAVAVTLTEAPDGGTELSYDADATVGGMIGGVGQRMLAGVSKKMAAEFFGNVDALLANGGAGAVGGGLREGGLPEGGLSDEGAPPIQPRFARQPDPSTGGAPSPGPPSEASGGAPTPSGRAAGDTSAGQVFTAPADAAGRFGGQSAFAAGVVAGAAAALAGALVGGWLAGRRAR